MRSEDNQISETTSHPSVRYSFVAKHQNPGTLVFTPNKTGRYAGFMQGLSEGTHNSGIRPFMMISMISYQIGHLSHGIFHKMVGIFHDITDHLT